MIARLAAIALAVTAPALLAQTFDPFHEARIDGRPGARLPLDAPLLDENGHRTSLRALGAGKPVLLVPVLHDCPNLCGVTLAGVADAIAAQRRRGFVTVAFGIDPREGAGEAAADLTRLARRHPELSDVHATVAPERSIRAVTNAIGYHFAWDERIGQYAHAAASAVLTPDGRLSGWLYGLTPEPAALAAAVSDAREGRAGSWTEQLLLLCYHYDPVSGRYTPAIEKILRVAAGLTVATLALLLLRLRRPSATT